MITAGIVLTLAASDDQQARALHLPVTAFVWLYRFLFPFGSIAAGIVAAILARNLRVRYDQRGSENERVVALTRNADGGFDEEEPQPA